MTISPQYIILTIANYTTEQLSVISEQCCTTQIQYWRYNNDKTKCIVSTTSPSLLTNHTSYNSIEINKIVLREEWLDEDVY